MKYSHFPLENSVKKISLSKTRQSIKKEQELWKFVGINNKTVVLGNAIASKSKKKTFFRPKTGRASSLIQNKDKLLLKSSYVSRNIYKEGLSFIHRAKNNRKNAHSSLSPFMINDRNYQIAIDFNVYKPLLIESINTSIEVKQKKAPNPNKSQEILIKKDFSSNFDNPEYTNISIEAKNEKSYFEKKKKNLCVTNLKGWDML